MEKLKEEDKIWCRQAVITSEVRRWVDQRWKLWRRSVVCG
jgi:hypothetical protein